MEGHREKRGLDGLEEKGHPDLPAHNRSTFKNGEAVPVNYPEGTLLYRYWGGPANRDGGYWLFGRAADVRAEAALPDRWNSLEHVEVRFVGKGGARGWEGVAGPQNINETRPLDGLYPGGARQVWLPPGERENLRSTLPAVAPTSPQRRPRNFQALKELGSPHPPSAAPKKSK